MQFSQVAPSEASANTGTKATLSFQSFHAITTDPAPMLAFREFVRIALSKQYHLHDGLPLDAAPISLTRAVAKATHASHLPTLWGDLGR